MAWLAYKVAEAMVIFFLLCNLDIAIAYFKPTFDAFVSITKATKDDVLAVDRTTALKAAFITMNAV